jgi:hypothetical protein
MTTATARQIRITHRRHQAGRTCGCTTSHQRPTVRKTTRENMGV